MDKALHNLLIQNDRKAQKAVYFEHCDRLMHIVIRYIQPISIAEEVLQDTFLRIFDQIYSFDEQKGKFESWTARIAITSSLMALRKMKQGYITLEDLTIIDPNSHGEANPLWEQDISYIINQLPEKQALVFKLKAIEGFSYDEIKSLLELNDIANSRKIYSLARQRLQSLFKVKYSIFYLLIIQKFI